MKKSVMGFLLLIMSCIIMSACGDKAENTGITETKAVVAKGTEENAPDEVYEYLSEQADPVVHESDMGYSMTYDPSVITLDDTGEADIFSYVTAVALDAPVYISVMRYEDMDAETLTEGLILQSGIDGLKAESTYFGTASIETQCIYMERDVEGMTQIQIFYVIPMAEGSMLVEIGGYIEAPAQADAEITSMLGTFYLD